MCCSGSPCAHPTEPYQYLGKCVSKKCTFIAPLSRQTNYCSLMSDVVICLFIEFKEVMNSITKQMQNMERNKYIDIIGVSVFN